MERQPSTSIHSSDLYTLDNHTVGRRKVLPTAKPVVFRLHAPGAKLVWLVGKFADNGFKNHEMKKTMDGYWECSVQLKHGHYEYHFLVDGSPTTDPRSHARVPDDLGGFNSVLEVS